MVRLGTFLLIFGVGTFILSIFGMEFRLMRIFGNYQMIAAGVMAVLGLGVMAIGMMRTR